MQCKYREKAFVCGDMLFVSVIPTWRQTGRRRGRFRPTSEDQKRLNEKYSMLRLQMLVHENFDRNDYRLDLTYSDRYLPADEEQFKRDCRNFAAKMRRYYAREGVELRYIIFPAYSESGRPHVHFFIKGGVNFAELAELWGMGRVSWCPLEFDECGVIDLSFYYGSQKKAGKTDTIHERAKGQRRWSGSRNLRKPVERTDVHTYARHELEMLADAGTVKRHTFFSLAYPGYWLSEQPRLRFNDVNKAWYMDAVLYRPDSQNLATYARRDDDAIRGRRRKRAEA
ncbi:MAG: hypothetical protein IKZ41_00500 [Clostridia bacterium]|nr:hypothetical protein [Clostridia bacterium]MBR5366979.1 hypothetical protein [Clostridia bacterium]